MMTKFLILFLFSLSAFASNWMTLSTIESKGVAGYSLRSDCEKYGEQCLDVGAEPEAIKLGFFSLADVMEDDHEKPIWGTRSMVEPCSDELDCQMRMSALNCVDGRSAYYSLDPMEVWCNKITGYEQKISGKKSLSINASQMASYKGQLQAKAQTEALIANGKKAREACDRVLDLIGGFNLLPGRTSGQTDTMTSTFAEAKGYLQDGRPGKARHAIQNIPVDGVLVTQPMKDLALSFLQDHEAVP